MTAVAAGGCAKDTSALVARRCLLQDVVRLLDVLLEPVLENVARGLQGERGPRLDAGTLHHAACTEARRAENVGPGTEDNQKNQEREDAAPRTQSEGQRKTG
jgi:hypothetical protein